MHSVPAVYRTSGVPDQGFANGDLAELARFAKNTSIPFFNGDRVDEAQRIRIRDDLQGLFKGELLFDDLSRALYNDSLARIA